MARLRMPASASVAPYQVAPRVIVAPQNHRSSLSQAVQLSGLTLERVPMASPESEWAVSVSPGPDSVRASQWRL